MSQRHSNYCGVKKNMVDSKSPRPVKPTHRLEPFVANNGNSRFHLLEVACGKIPLQVHGSSRYKRKPARVGGASRDVRIFCEFGCEEVKAMARRVRH